MKRSAARQPKSNGTSDDNPQVSAVSRFHDEIWDFSHEDRNPSSDRSAKRIRWAFATPDGGLFSDPQFRNLLLALKHFLFALRWHPIDSRPLGVSTLVAVFRRAKRFVLHLLDYPNPVLRFRDVLPHHCQEYMAKVLNSSLNIGYKYHCISTIEKLRLYSGIMRDGMIVEPLNGEHPGDVVGWDLASLLERQTEVIPDDVLGPLVRASLEYVDHFADYLLDASKRIEEIRREGLRLNTRATQCLQQLDPSAYRLDGTKFETGLNSAQNLNRELCFLQTACFVLIAFSTGMRISEVLSLREGCCEIQASAGEADLVWLRSRVFKMQGVPDGREARWIGGSVCARAVDVLERLTRPTREQTKVDSLWVPIPSLIRKPRDPGPLKGDTIRYRLEVFVAMLGLKDPAGGPSHLHPHMFRRTFARHVVRHDTTNLLALKEHFKHVSLSMTDHYVGSDLELWALMMEEEEKLSFESFDKALRAERLAGPGGVRLKRKIDSAIAEGRIQREFRGEAGAHLRKQMIRDLVESGQRIYPCAASNFCWFRPESALCTGGDHPLLKRCNPGACMNSIITPKHKPHWEKIRSDCEDLMALKPQAEPYQKALRDLHAVSSTILRGLT